MNTEGSIFDCTDIAMGYFRDYLPLLGVPISDDVAEGDLESEIIHKAFNAGKVGLVDAILGRIANDTNEEIPEEVVLGALAAVGHHAESELSYGLFGEDVPSELRQAALGKIELVVTRIFPRRCLSATIRDVPAGRARWNLLCFEWWDSIPRAAVIRDRYLLKTDGAIVELLGRVLQIDHLACKESALRGLGIWCQYCPDQVIAIIEAQALDIPTILSKFASVARRGDMR